MHESSIVSSLVHRLEAVSRERQGRILSVKVRLGALSHISPAHFREHFQHETRGTVAEGAALEVEALSDVHDPRAQDILLESVELET